MEQRYYEIGWFLTEKTIQVLNSYQETLKCKIYPFKISENEIADLEDNPDLT